MVVDKRPNRLSFSDALLDTCSTPPMQFLWVANIKTQRANAFPSGVGKTVRLSTRHPQRWDAGFWTGLGMTDRGGILK